METVAFVILLLSALCVPLWVVLRLRESARRRQALREKIDREENERENKYDG